MCGSLYSTFTTSVYPYITNGYKRFSKTNSTEERQRVPLIDVEFESWIQNALFYPSPIELRHDIDTMVKLLKITVSVNL